MAKRSLDRTKSAVNRHVAECDWIRAFAHWARGDPQLTSWEERFLTELAVDTYPLDRRYLSAKQGAILDELVERLGYGEPRPHRSLTGLLSSGGAQPD